MLVAYLLPIYYDQHSQGRAFQFPFRYTFFSYGTKSLSCYDLSVTKKQEHTKTSPISIFFNLSCKQWPYKAVRNNTNQLVYSYFHYIRLSDTQRNFSKLGFCNMLPYICTTTQTNEQIFLLFIVIIVDIGVECDPTTKARQ